MSIPFTQYLMPRGLTQEVEVDRSPEVEEKAQLIIKAGYRFECEMLSDYKTISLTISDPKLDEDIACELVPNGPEVPLAVDRLIRNFKLDREMLSCNT